MLSYYQHNNKCNKSITHSPTLHLFVLPHFTTKAVLMRTVSSITRKAIVSDAWANDNYHPIILRVHNSIMVHFDNAHAQHGYSQYKFTTEWKKYPRSK